MFQILRHGLFALDSEVAHALTIAAVRGLPLPAPARDKRLRTQLAGLEFPSPLGLAAGFDKDAQAAGAMLRLGLGFVEVGTLTPLPQPGNPRPRLFRLVEDEGVINRLGFNNGGQAAAHARLSRRARAGGIVGVNIGANKDSADRIGDYAMGVRAMSDVADYLTINISSPNTPGLRGLQDEGALTALLDAIDAARTPATPPIFLKLAPDLDTAAIDGTVRVAMGRVAALIIGNTTLSRPPLRSRHAGETGGLSGAPLQALAMEKLRAFRSATGGALPLIAAGGIDSADEAWARIRAGASLVQLYTALVYQGPALIRRINYGLVAHLERVGLASISDAVGLDAK